VSCGAGHGTGSRGPQNARKNARKNDATDVHEAPTRCSNAVGGPTLRGAVGGAADSPP